MRSVKTVCQTVILTMVVGLGGQALFIKSAFAADSQPAKLGLTASFANGAVIPKRYTGDGQDDSPALSWTKAPAGTVSIAVSCEDPDAPRGTWWHWILFNLDAQKTSLPEGLEKNARLAGGAMQGNNDFEKPGYNGPAPPPGSVHRYYYRVYALNTKLNLAAGANKDAFKAAIAGHILGYGEIMGTYSRK